MIDLMQPRPAELIQLRYMTNVLVQPKLDGVRAVWSPEDRCFYSRNNKRLTVPHLTDEWSADDYIGRFQVDGELYSHGMALGRIASAARFNTADTDLLQFHAFDIRLEDTDAYKRNKLLRYIEVTETLPNTFKVFTVQESKGNKIPERLATFIDDGFEGVVVKNTDGFYWPGRHGGCFKYKPTIEAEYELVGFNTDTSIILKRKRTVFNVGGLSREQMAECLAAGVGSSITVVADKAPVSGKPRFPRFKTVRSI